MSKIFKYLGTLLTFFFFREHLPTAYDNNITMQTILMILKVYYLLDASNEFFWIG